MNYSPDPDRYNKIEYRRCGKSGIKLPPYPLDCGKISVILIYLIISAKC
jgi:hypothetical protein